MKNLFLARFPRGFCALFSAGLALVSIPAFATTTTFTNNTSIGVANTNYDGTDVVITNCTVTMDGSHAFSSLHVAAGGVLTHSFAPGGAVSNLYYVTNEVQVLYGTTPVTLLYSNVITATVVITDLTATNFYTNGQDYLLTSPDGIVTQLQRTTNSTIPDGGIVLVSYEGYGTPSGTVPGGLYLTVTDNVLVDTNGAINANGAGYSNGPGSGAYTVTGSGGGYGGNGGAGSSNVIGGSPYGSFLQATNLGSGGGATGGNSAGGGLIQIAAGGTVTINGLVSANGANGINNFAGGGSGGGINITGLSLSGSGMVAANGGAGEGSNGGGGGGGGGRISFQYSSTTFTGLMTAYGGLGSMFGTAGTIYTQVSGQNGLLVFDNGGQLSATNTTLTIQNFSVNVLIRNDATVQPPNLSGSWSFASLTVASNGFLIAPYSTTLTLSANSAVIVEPGGKIFADGRGYGPGNGTGAGHYYDDNLYWPCGGGSYGGSGAFGSSTNATGGATYGAQSSPSGFGSGGGSENVSIGGSGGGAISIITGGIVQVDGVISANGQNGSGTGGGGGSGGTIILSGGTLLGSGIISANGGSGANSFGGGGGGGRIWINPSASIFAGTVSAYGGGGANQGGAGTVLMQVPGQNIQLILDNGGNLGTNTPVQSAGSTDLIVRGGAVGSANPSVDFANLYIYSNAWLTPVYVQSGPADSITFSFSGNATIQAGGGIVANLAGYAPGQGSGTGHVYTSGETSYCSGAGHGGTGGNSFGNYAIGGSTYDSPTAPDLAGSGGGSSSPLSPGGAGGGMIRLSVSGTLEVDGIVSANGGNGSGLAGGGGSGGSIWFSAGTFSGAGSVSANGGTGANNSGGGGSGGMIYISSANNLFTGSSTAYGGGGANWGGAGTVLFQGTSGNSQLVLDGGGNPGALTPLPNSSSINVTLRNGAVGFVNGSLTTGNLLVSSNASLLVSNTFDYILSCSSLTVQAGGSIIGDYEGSPAGQGNGAGHFYGQSPDYPCSGGGNGGNGGNSISNLALGGVITESYSESVGSGGGTDSPYSIGGSGGGVISITTTGLMQIDGIISANGANGGGIGGGGGAGGSIALSAGSLGGQGLIRANGGSGANSIGGGGGGGWISITMSSTASQFNGTLTAYGGGGANWGGAGMILTQTNGQTVQVVLDNGGNSGAGTPLLITSSPSLTVRNAAIGLVGSSLSVNGLVIASNASLLVSNYPGSSALITVSSADIEAGGSIIADTQGYPEGQGSGAGRSSGVSPNFPCSGAGHGGTGGNAYTNAVAGGAAYDSQTSPGNPGSGGGYYLPYSLGGTGGGAMSITASGLIQVDGVISASGGNGSGIGGGGGSGGSIKLTAPTLSGGGSIRANGGSGGGSIGGGGAGGCIAINPETANLFTGTISASGGGGANWGGAGTIYIQTNGGASQLILDNSGQTGAPTPINTASSTMALILRNGAVAYQQSVPQTFASLLIASSGLLTASSNSGVVNLTLTGNATIEAGGGIVTDNLGSAPNTGAGGGTSSGATSPYYPSSGGGYGGVGGYSSNSVSGGVSGGYVYGSITSPTSTGSGGGGFSYSLGGSGGGSIHLTVNGTLDASGRISANGGNGGGLGGGGGSGGSILLTLYTFEGTAAITANGGNGAGNFGGGGGGGRIAITYNTDAFSGPITAHGGDGSAYGGAGTIYTKANSQSVGQVLVENGGAAGTNTPLSVVLGAPSFAFNLIIESNAVVSPQMNTTFPLLNRLTISSGGVLTGLPGLTTLDLLVFGDVDIAAGGFIQVNGEGYSQASGPGAGQTGDDTGSGAGYGGAGGATLDAPGGVSYGLVFQPVDFGSGGGIGYGIQSGGSSGGGALRLNVGGILIVDGEISAEGGAAIQENWGGGSGGSIWVDTGALTGGGLVAADGGEGQDNSGGGGAGGRIALYIRTNAFFGSTSANGGAGYSSGASGTIFTSNNVPTLQVLSNSLNVTLTNGVTSLVLYFSGAPNPNSINAGTVFLTAPNGTVSPTSASSMLTFSSYLVSFPLQTAVGVNTLTVSNVVDLYGRALSPVYTATFNLSLPVIQGTVTDGYGNPLPGIVLQPSTGSSATTDTNGNYSLGFVPGSSLTVTPSSGSLTFLPPSMSYANLSASVSGQNYIGVTTIAPMLSAAVNATNFNLNWQALPGVNYQVYCSTDLINWLPYGGAMTGSNGPVQLLIPTTGNPQQFFSVQPSY